MFTPERKRGPRGPYKKRGGSESVSSQSQAPGEAVVSTQPPAISSDEIVRPTIDVIDAWVAKIAKNEKARMQLEEKNGICKSLGLLLDKYAPVAVEKYAPELMAIMALSAYGTRVYAIMKHDSELRQKEYADKVKSQQMHIVPDEPKDNVPAAGPAPHLNGANYEVAPKQAKTKLPNAFANLPGQQ